MSPHREGGKGSYILDRVFIGVGRIKRSSGTNKIATFRAIDRTLTLVYEYGRLDVLRDLRDGLRKPMAVYREVQEKGVEGLSRGGMTTPLIPALWAWSKTADVGEYQRASYGVAIRRFERMAKAGAPVAELPPLVRRAREIMRTEGHRRGFNILRATALAFARDTSGRHSPLWTECASVQVLKLTKRVRPFFAYADLVTIANALPEKWARVCWNMALTGMGPREYFGEWRVRADRIHIEGTKRAGRVRDIPVVDLPLGLAAPLSTHHTFRGFTETFRRALASASGNRMTPYDLRRTYSRWLELAEIPRTRRQMYMGHGANDVTAGYERAEVTAFLLEDGTKFQAWLDRQKASLTPTLVREAQ